MLKRSLAAIHNPILWQESTHQQRSAPRMVRYGRLLYPLALLAIIVGIPLLLIDFQTALDHTVFIALFAMWVVNTAVAARAIIAGANAISREHVGLTWDSLVLTGMSARQILMGKWRAALNRVAPWMFSLGVARLAMLPVLLYSVTVRLSYFWAQRNISGSYSYYYDEEVFFLQWVPEAAVIAVVACVALALLEVAACTALGLAASALTRRGTVAAALAFSLRFAPVAIFAGFVRYELGANSFRWFRTTLFSIADGGTSPLYQFMVPVSPWTYDRHLSALVHLGLCILLYAGMLALGLGITLYVIRRTGALNHVRRVAPITVFKLR